ncbi:MAG: ABC transporter permease [Vicinamibacterales bacterium]
MNINVMREGRTTDLEPVPVSLLYASPDYTTTLSIPIVRGRPLMDSDGRSAASVVLVSEAMVKRHFKSEDPLGQRIRLAGEAREIVGIMGDVPQVGWGEEEPIAAMPTVLMPLAQTPDASITPVHRVFAPVVVARTTRSRAEIQRGIERALSDIDPLLPVARAETIDEVVRKAVARPRALASIMSGFSLVAVGLAAVGAYGLTAARVARRRTELGIRLALGATRCRVILTVVGPNAVAAVAGVAGGLILAGVASQLVRHMVRGLEPMDPISLASGAAVVVGSTLIASLSPALQAARDPSRTFRAGQPL